MGRKQPAKHTGIKSMVKAFRLKKGWSQEELALQLDIRRQAVYDIESGRYLPNTAIALRLARLFGCRVEDLFVEQDPPDNMPVHVINGVDAASPRLALGRVRDRLVGIALQGAASIPFGLRSADGLLRPDGKSARLLTTPENLNKSILLMGCDPAFEILAAHVGRRAPASRVHCGFASSHRALNMLAEGYTHVAGTHLHNAGTQEANVVTARKKLAGVPFHVMGFSIMEEGLMVAKGNPLNIHNVIDLAQPMVRLVNREAGAALRVLLDTQLERAGIDAEAIRGYEDEVMSHGEGAHRIVCNAADAALGFRVIAEVFEIDFVPLATTRCDLVIPDDMTEHPTIKVLLDVLQSAPLRREIDAVPGYASTATGDTIAQLSA
ncbi:substrate-binding domain-containing protein [Desulfatitalea alkaliphila]|uniref:Helix-turn-helix domain-containing protein n=1 Tax=Desulfatitalea alkaliphila TaxID=2929485 RepID=A0AA41R1A4_9BACT|nr:substrate-binding domain-containing protein [Desulfatitalea alkaliphila]MCJ8499806.1 helix-turn-helix domain-containing protein [Desulfatitalea alkaliphila]